MNAKLWDSVRRLIQLYKATRLAPVRRPGYQRALAEVEAAEPVLTPIALQRQE